MLYIWNDYNIFSNNLLPIYNKKSSEGALAAHLRKYRIIESCSNEMNFSRLQTADFEGLLVAS